MVCFTWSTTTEWIIEMKWILLHWTLINWNENISKKLQLLHQSESGQLVHFNDTVVSVLEKIWWLPNQHCHFHHHHWCQSTCSEPQRFVKKLLADMYNCHITTGGGNGVCDLANKQTAIACCTLQIQNMLTFNIRVQGQNSDYIASSTQRWGQMLSTSKVKYFLPWYYSTS